MVERLEVVAIGAVPVLSVAVDQADRVVGQDAVEVDPLRADLLLPHAAAALELGQVARRFLQGQSELVFQLDLEMPGELNGPRGIAEALRGFQPADLVEEPAAAGEHQQPVPLHFQQPERLADVVVVAGVGLAVLA